MNLMYTMYVVGSVLELEMRRVKKEVPEPLQNFFDMWKEVALS
jgi:hypothetical protein